MVEAATAELESAGSKGDKTHGQVLVKAIIEGEDGPRPSRSVMADDRLAAKESAHEAGEVLQLSRGNAGDAIGILGQWDAAAEPEHEAPAGEALHGPRKSGGHHGMARVVVRRCGLDGDPLTDGPGGTGEGGHLLAVEAFGDEGGAEPHRFAVTNLLDDRPGRSRVAARA